MKPHQLLWRYHDQRGNVYIETPQRPTILHTHNFDELVFVLSGSGMHIVNKDRYPLKRGDVFLIKGDQAHKYEKTKNLHIANLEYYWEHFKFLEKEFADLQGFKALFVHEPRYRKSGKFNAKLHLNSWQLSEIIHLLDLIIEEQKKRLSGFNCVLESLVKIIIIRLCRFYSETNQLGPKTLMNISVVIDYIENHFAENLTIANLSKISKLSETTFRSTFKKITGSSPIDYLIHFRIEKAAEMMRENPGLHVIEVCLNVGYENTGYFARKFGEIIGTTPINYIRKQRKMIE